MQIKKNIVETNRIDRSCRIFPLIEKKERFTKTRSVPSRSLLQAPFRENSFSRGKARKETGEGSPGSALTRIKGSRRTQGLNE